MKPRSSSIIARAPAVHPTSWLRRLLGQSRDRPLNSIRITDVDLKRIGHLAPVPTDAPYAREEFRLIKRRLLNNIRDGSKPQGRDPRVVIVTSACPGDGKTFIASNLAMSLAIDRGVGVTLIDGDVTSQGATRRFNLFHERGLLDALDESLPIIDVLQDTNLPNLDFVPAGAPRTDAAELLSGERMSTYIADVLARSDNQLVVLDSGGLLTGSIPVSLAAYAGQIIFVVASNETRRTLIEESLTLLDSTIGPLEDANLGIVLNKINPAQSAARYSTNRS